ncbi:prohibitin family protein [Fulvivirgaceae bacterium BMA12]|uniref:Prohibitin family protein n=1 Tax=Agaribacillus aureus TaxID=3051825 RepID=A0ABT8L5N2_9BACT|nr:prohibitin family protein [Fulvivirgaceae bacterium BMA12]
MKKYIILILLIQFIITSGCTVVRQGEVGVKRKLGKLNDKTIQPGVVAYNPFLTKVIKLPVRTVNLEITSNLPSKEGLNVGAIISILYRIKQEKAPSIIENIGPAYEEVVITSVFRSASADVCSRFFAKDMHTAQRSTIETEITSQMSHLLNDRGFEIEAVLLKTIQLPQGLSRAVEEKLEAEQDAQRMEFLLQRERLEAQRKLVEAKGTRDAQKIISEGLNKEILQWQTIEAFKKLSESPNSKVIITNGNTPLLMNEIEGN